MKVIILNGSPKANGNTATALHEVECTLQQQGIETEWIHVGHPSRPAAVRFAEDSGRANRNALYQIMRRILSSFFLLLSDAVSAQENGEDQFSIEGFINRQLQTYPKSRLLDIYKSCFQDYMGAEHLVSDRQSVKAYLDEELKTTSLDDLMRSSRSLMRDAYRWDK